MNKQAYVLAGLCAWLGGSVAALAQAAPGPGLVPAKQVTQPVREIYVPFEDLSVILENDKNRVFLTRGEYDELVVRATSRPELASPIHAAIVAAEYRGRLDEGRAVIMGRMTIEVMAAGIYALPLDLGGVGLRSAVLDGRPAPLVRASDLQDKGEPQKARQKESGGRPMLIVEGLGSHELMLELTAPIATAAAQQTLQFRAPMTVATRLFLSAPGNIEAKAGAAVISRSYDEAAGRTELELLAASPGDMSIILSLNNRLLKDERTMVASSVIVAEVTQGYERIHATISYRVLHGAVEKIRASIPAGFETTTVEADRLARWEEKAAAAGRKVVEVTLQEPSTEKVVVRLVANRSPTVQTDWLQELGGWSFPVVEPLDVAGQNAVLGLAAEDRLHVESLSATGLIPIDSSGLASAIPASVLKAEPGAPAIRQVVSYFAPAGDYTLAAALSRALAEVNVISSSLLVIRDQGLKLQGALSVAPRAESLFALHLALPAGWQMTSVTDLDGGSLVTERYPDSGGQSRTLVRLARGIPPGAVKTIHFEAEHAPAGWLGGGGARTVEFPKLSVEESTSHTGAITAQGVDDLLLRPGDVTGLTPIADREKPALGLVTNQAALAYRFDQADYSATVMVDRVSPSVTARTYAFLTLQPDYLIAHYELDYDIREARVQELTFSLPLDSPAEVTVRGLDGLTVKDVRSEDVDKRRRWTAQLADRRLGRVRLAVDFARRLSYDGAVLLPLAAAENVEYQSGLVAVEGHPELEVRVATDARPADIGEASGAEQPLGRFVAGTFRYVGEAPEVSVTVGNPPSHPLPAALVERAELVTRVSASGLAQSAARFHLLTKATLLEVRLPAHSELWSVMVDGQPVKPQREQDRLLISLPAQRQPTPRSLQVVYESRVARLGFHGNLDVEGPRLFVRSAGKAAERAIPQADLVWHLYLPSGYQVMRSSGTVELTDDVEEEPGIVRLGKWLYRLAGGVRPWAQRTATNSNRLSQLEGSFAKTTTAIEQASPQQPARRIEVMALEDAYGMTPPDAAAAPANGSQLEGKAVLDAAQALTKGAKAKAQWALEGVSSLKINIDQAVGTAVSFRSLGENPRLVAVAVDSRRLSATAGGLGLLVALIGVGLTGRPRREQIAFLVAVAIVSTLPLVLLESFATERPILDAILLAGCWVAVWYCSAAVFRAVYSRLALLIPARVTVSRPAQAMTLLAVLCLLFRSDIAWADKPQPEDNTPVKVPADAIIIPYDPEKPEERDEAGKVLVPYAKYLELWNKAYPARPLAAKASPVDFAIAGTAYEAALDSGDSLAVVGRMSIDVFRNGSVEVPLALAGGMIERMNVDGEPGRLSVAEPAAGAKERLFLLHLTEKGRKEVEFRVRLTLSRQGGWRRVQAQLPVGLAASLTVQVPNAGTEIRQGSMADRGNMETDQAPQSIRWALPPTGVVDFQWRAKVASAMIDEALTVHSTALLDVRDDGLRVTWQMRLEFGRSQRDAFTLLAPTGYLVEAVQGANVRAWTRNTEDEVQRIEIELLKTATGAENISVVLSRRGRVSADESERIKAPAIDVEGTALHQGEVMIRHSPRLSLRTVELNGIVQAEPSANLDEVQKRANANEAAVLQPRVFQTFHFPRMPYRLIIAASESKGAPVATVRAALRIAANETTLDAAVILRPVGPPLYEVRLSLPADLKVTRVGPADLEWFLTEERGAQILTVLLADGRTNEFMLTLLGELPTAMSGPSTERSVKLPRIAVVGAAQQEGEMAILPDPDTDIRVEELRGAIAAPLISPLTWMKAEQQPLAKIVVRFQKDDYAGVVIVRPRMPLVSARSITNIKITPRSIEETVLLNFQIQQAGIRQVQVLLPDHLAKARLKARLLRQRRVEPAVVDGQPLAGMVRMTLDLEDDVRGEYAVLLEHDRPLSSTKQTVVPPTILTGRTDRRLVGLENAGQDEVVVDPGDARGLEPVNRQEQAWRDLAAVLGQHVTVAYAVREGSTSAQLQFRTLTRPRAVQATARIGLATTLLVIDRAGAYRAAVQFRVSNETEPYLQITLPEGASLWTAFVAGDAVKPAEVTPARPGVVRIPLVKTAEGEGDYVVELKYGGQMRPPGLLRSVAFPLIQETNINVERSIVRLLVPESSRWFAFTGSMRMVEDEQQLAAGYHSYLYRRIQDAAAALASGSDYTKVRASVNLKQSKQLFEESQSLSRSNQSSGPADKFEQASQALLERAEQQVQQQLVDPEPLATDNRMRLNEFYFGQEIERSKNIVSELGSNFDSPQAGSMDSKDALNRQWFEQNRLVTDGAEAARPANAATDMRAGAFGGPASSRLGRRGGAAGEKELLLVPGLAQAGQNAPAIAGNAIEDLQQRQQDEAGIAEARKRASVGQVEDLRRYQRNLERLDADSLSFDARTQDAGAARGALAAGGGQMPGEQSAARTTGRSDPTQSSTEPPTGGYLAAPDERLGQVFDREQFQQLSAGLASLDVALPERGQLYRFTTVRGKVAISARAVSRTTLSKLVVVGLLLLAGGIGRGVSRPAFGRLWNAAVNSPAFGGVLIVSGLGSVASGILPVAGLALVAIGMAWMVRLKWARPAAI